jgi:hypothetical protein
VLEQRTRGDCNVDRARQALDAVEQLGRRSHIVLADVIARARREPELAIFRCIHAGDHDHRKPGQLAIRPHESHQLDAVGPRHLTIRHHHVEGLLLEAHPGLRAVFLRVNFVARPGERATKPHEIGLRVVDQQNAHRTVRPRARRRRRSLRRAVRVERGRDPARKLGSGLAADLAHRILLPRVRNIVRHE